VDSTGESLVTALVTLKSILRPAICGTAIYRGSVFAELTDVLDRIVILESGESHLIILQIVENLAVNHPSSKRLNGLNDANYSQDNDQLSTDMEQLFDLTRTTALALQSTSTWMTHSETSRTVQTNDTTAVAALKCLVTIAESFVYVIKLDLYGLIFQVYHRMYYGFFSNVRYTRK
jgi:hypothetical protein